MKKNIDPQTAKLFEAVKTAYFRECSGIVRDNKELKPLTVDIMNQLLNGGNVNNMTIAEGVDRNKRIELMEGYTCGLASLPRIYKQVARLAGETCEKITVADALPPYGITAEVATAKENKKLMSVIKKVCKFNSYHICDGYVYHDAARQCAVWTDAHVLILSRALYNPAAAGMCVDANGIKGDYKYPNYGPAIPDYSDCVAVASDTVVDNCAAALTAAKNIKKTYGNTESTDIFNVCMIESQPVGLNCQFLQFLKLIEGQIYALRHDRPICGYINRGDGFVLLMPKMVPDFMALDNNTVYCQTEVDCTIRRAVPTGHDSHADFKVYLNTAETPAADAAEVAADPVADVETVAEVVEVETPAEVVADATPDKKNLTPGTIIDYPEFDYKASGIIISGPIYKENIDSWQYIAIKEYGTMSTVNADNITAIYPCQDADTAAEMVEYAKQQRVACMRRVKKTWSENLINYINIIEDYEAAQDAAADAAEVVETPAPAAAPCVALVVVPVADAEPQPEPAAAPVRDAADIEAELTAAVIRCHYSSMMAQAEPLPVVDTYDIETLSDNAAIIRCRRRGASCLIALTPRNENHYTVTSLKDGAIFTPQWSMPAARHYDDETIRPFVIWCMRDAIHDAIIYFDTLPIVADAEPAAEPVPMLPDPPAVVHVSGPVPPSPRRRRQAPRLRPIFRRLWRVAAVVVPLVVLAMLTASTAADNSHQAPAADAVAITPAAALSVAVDADTLHVVELPPLTVTAPRTPSGQKTGLTPSSQKTAAAVADASPTDEPTADTPAGQKTDADGLPDTLQPDSQPHGLTICEGTAWAYTMMNWA